MQKRILFLSIALFSYSCILSQYIIIGDNNAGGINLPVAQKLVSSTESGMCQSPDIFSIDLDLDGVDDVRFTSNCSWGGPYMSSSVSIRTYNNFYIIIDTNFTTTFSYENLQGQVVTEQRKVIVPFKYQLNDTIYKNAYSWSNTETCIGSYSFTSYGTSIVHTNWNSFEGDAAYVGLFRKIEDSVDIFYVKIKVHSSCTMKLLSVWTSNIDVADKYSHYCYPNGLTFSKQAQIDSFHDIALNCSRIEGDLVITGDDIVTLYGLYLLSSINGSLEINNNSSLFDLTGLHNLVSIDGNIHIQNNSSLLTLSGIDNINPTTINNLLIRGNDSLSFCNVRSICDYLSQNDSRSELSFNGDGCWEGQVKDGCDTISNIDCQLKSDILIYPNPAKKELYVENIKKNNEINIYNINGQKLLNKRNFQGKLNISYLNPGLYILELKTEDINQRLKLLIK